MTGHGQTLLRPTAAWVTHEGAARALRWAAAAYALVWAIHTGDHIRRGTGIVTTEVLVAGSVAAILQLSGVAAVFLRWRWAPLMAIAIGFPDALGITAVHLLPHWSSFSDAFPGAHGTGVTAFSWFAATSEIIGALAFGIAGIYAWRAARGQPVIAPPEPASA